MAVLNFRVAPHLRDDGALTAATLTLHVEGLESTPLVVFLESTDRDADSPGGVHDSSVRIASVDNAFEPPFQVAPVGAQVEVSNRDGIAHNTHVFTTHRRTLFNVALPSPDTIVRKALTQAGLFEVRCDIHPWMRAWLFVAPSTPHAVVWGTGDVTLTGIAPGRYRLHEWQPSRGEAVRTLALASGETASLTWSRR